MVKRFCKKLYILSLISLFLVSTVILPVGAATFSDVTEGNVFYVPVTYLFNRGLVKGYEDGTFKPDQHINRAEGITLLFAAFAQLSFEGHKNSQSSPQPEFNFPDVKPSDWFYIWVKKSWDLQVVKGYPDGLFHPERHMNRAEALKTSLIAESLTLTGVLPLLPKVDTPPYPDMTVDVWFAPYAQLAKERTLCLPSRENGGMDPDYLMSRGDFAMLIYRILRSREGVRFARATWYEAGTRTASGEPFDPNKLTAAHRTLPFGTELLVRNLANGKTVKVKINDRGPFSTGLDLDLSRGAFNDIASLNNGVIVVEYEEIKSHPSG